MKKIYVVMGTTGEYSDRSDWPVCAYNDEASAQAHVENATAKAKRIEVEIKPIRYIDYTKMAELVRSNPYDPFMSMDYTGTTYYLNEVVLVTSSSDFEKFRKNTIKELEKFENDNA